MSRQLRIVAARNKIVNTFKSYFEDQFSIDIEHEGEDEQRALLSECVDDTLNSLLKPEGVK